MSSEPVKTPPKKTPKNGDNILCGTTCCRFLKAAYLFALFVFILPFVFGTFTTLQFRINVMQTVNPSESQHVMKELYRLARAFNSSERKLPYDCQSDTLTLHPSVKDAVKDVIKTIQTPTRNAGEKAKSEFDKKLEQITLNAQIEAQQDDPSRFKALTEEHRCGFERLKKLWMFDWIVNAYNFATIPGDYLTFMVTLAMGALGSLLYITKHFVELVLDRHKLDADSRLEPISWFFFRPILGMITALVVFIFVKAGQLAFANPGASGQAELNPYVVSFIAIASGYLCWQAIDSIQKAGERFFRGSVENARWAYGLEKAVESYGRSLLKESGMANTKITTEEALAHGATHLAQKLETSEEQLKHWWGQKETVPQNIQDQITHLLSINPPELFTDIPPDLQS